MYWVVSHSTIICPVNGACAVSASVESVSSADSGRLYQTKVIGKQYQDK